MDASYFWTLVGVGVGVVGIVVTIVLSRRPRPKVSIEVANAFPAYDTHLGDWCVSVEAINAGGAAATLSSWGFAFPDGANLVALQPTPGSTPLPYRIQPHSKATFLMPAEDILAGCAERGVDPSALKSWVLLQTGKKVYGGAPPISAT